MKHRHRAMPIERRQDMRHPGTGLTAKIGGRPYEVADISIGGLQIATPRLTFPAHAEIDLRLGTHDGSAESVAATCQIRRSGPSGTALFFIARTFPLMRFVIRHAARHLGHKPHIF